MTSWFHLGFDFLLWTSLELLLAGIIVLPAVRLASLRGKSMICLCALLLILPLMYPLSGMIPASLKVQLPNLPALSWEKELEPVHATPETPRRAIPMEFTTITQNRTAITSQPAQAKPFYEAWLSPLAPVTWKQWFVFAWLFSMAVIAIRVEIAPGFGSRTTHHRG